MFCAGTICKACYVEVFSFNKSIDVLNEGGYRDAVSLMQ